MSKAFRFNLQKVLDVRSQLEDQAKQALAKAQQALHAQREHLRVLRDTLADHLTAVSQAQDVTAADIWLWNNYKNRLDDDLTQGHAQEIQLAQDVQTRRMELIDRAKDRKLLEKLKETQAKRHETEQNRLEQAEFDEMATLRFRHEAL